MKHSNRLAALTVAVSLAAPLAPMAAQEALPVPEDDGFDLMEEGARLLMRGLMSEMAPALEEFEGLAREFEPALERFVAEMGPAMAGLMSAIDDIRNYQTPEILDNGDIIIRRREDAPPYVAPPEEIDL